MPALKTICATSTEAESETPVKLDAPKVATSDEPLGTVAGVQFAAVFQSLVNGLDFQVALPPWPEWMVRSNTKADKSVAVNVARNVHGSARG